MTTLNGHQNSTPQTTDNNLCLVVAVNQSRKMEMRALGYLYAMYKLPGETTATRGFAFKKHCAFEIDNGFQFDEKELLTFDENLRSSRVKDDFYPSLDDMSGITASGVSQDGVYPDTDRVQDLPTPSRPALAAPVVPTSGMSIEALMQFLTPEDQEDLKRQLAYTILAAKCMGVSQAAQWNQATSLAGVHFIPAFDPRYKENLR